MAGRRIVWEDVDIRIYIDQEELGPYFATRFEFTEDITIDSAKVQGSSIPQLDATYNGCSGSVEFLLQDGYKDPRELQERQVLFFKTRLPGGFVRMVFSRRAPSGSFREAFTVYGAILTPSDSVAESQRWQSSITWQGEDLVRIT